MKLSTEHVRYLKVLKDKPGVSRSTLFESLHHGGYNWAWFIRRVKRLIELGLVREESTDRGYRYFLTPKGEEVLVAVAEGRIRVREYRFVIPEVHEMLEALKNLKGVQDIGIAPLKSYEYLVFHDDLAIYIDLESQRYSCSCESPEHKEVYEVYAIYKYVVKKDKKLLQKYLKPLVDPHFKGFHFSDVVKVFKDAGLNNVVIAFYLIVG